MARTFRIVVTTTAESQVDVELSDDEITLYAEHLGVSPEELTISDFIETLEERALDGVPALGICCAGGSYRGEPTLSLGWTWTTSDGVDHVTEIPTNNLD